MKNSLIAIVVTTIYFGLLPVSNIFAKDANPTGVWNFSLTDSAVSGMCPMGTNGSGSITIMDEGGGAYSLKYLQGMVCNPADVCVLPGSCDGAECVFSTTVTVDNEGGQVTNTAKFTFEANHALGSGSSVYKHPKMTCSWTYLLMLTK